MSKLRCCSRVLGFMFCGAVSLWSQEAAEPPETVRFTFAPPDGTVYLQTVETTRRKQFEGLGSQTDETRSVAEVTVHAVESGYEIVSKTVSARSTRDGAPLPDPISDILKQAVIRYRVDHHGVVSSIEGFGGLVDRLVGQVPAEVAQALAAALGEEALVARATAEWNGRITDFAGTEAEVGKVFEAQVPFALPNGSEVVYDLRTWVSGLEPCEQSRCARIELRYDSDASALSDLLESTGKALSGLADGFELSASGSRIVGGGWRLMDPSTMLIYHEDLHRTISMEVEIPGYGKVPSRLEEERVYSFDYSSAKDTGGTVPER